MPPRATSHVSHQSIDTDTVPPQPSPQENTADMPSSSSSSPPTPLPSLQERKRKVQNLIKTVIAPLKNNDDTAIPDEYLQKKCRVPNPKFKILDFCTGRVVLGKKDVPLRNDQFIRPMDPARVNQALYTTGVQKLRDDLCEPPNRNPRYEADDFWSLINIHLTHHLDQNKHGFQVTDTRWHSTSHNGMSAFTQRISSDGCNIEWQVKAVYQCCNKPRNQVMYQPPIDATKPHIICFHTVYHPLVEGKVLVSEMVVMMLLASSASVCRPVDKHRFYPVTLISASGRTFHITQCIFDIVNENFEIRQTPIYHLDKGVRKSRADEQTYLTLLGWLAGEPVGQTV